MSSLITKLLPPDHVIPDLDVTSKKRVFEHVGLMLENSIGFGRTLVYDALFARERLGSTGLGHGVAVPHGRIKGLKEPVGAFVHTHQPIPFEAPDGNPVGLIFVLLVPVKAHELHLRILSALAEMFSDAELRRQLAACRDPVQLHELITCWSPHAPDQHRAAV
ncbi:MAG: PTS sugar transporter subunit IIA [Burkholderiales bacterium]|nr:PTS sugar transporter subunit IIA [Burkholderiales bacterium]